MMHPKPGQPSSISRLLGVATTAAGTLVLLGALPSTRLPSRPDDIAPWWESVGTADATMAVLRHFTLVVAAWVLAVALFGAVVVAARWRPGVRLWHSITPVAMQRLAVASAVLAVASLPSAATAADAAGGRPVVRDLGPAGDDIPAPLLHDLGPANHPGTDTIIADSGHADPTAPDPPEGVVWVVEQGDHLWGIAEATLTERGEALDEGRVASYWREVIAANRATIGPDPDLIHPGTVLALP